MIHNKLKQIMAKTFGIKVSQVHEDSSIGNIESWDSLSHLSLIVAVEKGFGIKIEEMDIINMRCYSSIVKLLKKKGIS
jgi:acyl carrier protein